MPPSADARQRGRGRGLRGIARAWVEVLVRPRRFFATVVTPGDQAPGLTFAVVVATAFTVGWILTEPAVVPHITESVPLSALVVVAVVLVLAAPVGLHLTAAVAVVSLLVASVERRDGIRFRERGGVSETVQIVAYASAPLGIAGPPIPELRVVCGAYAAALLVVGIRIVHGTTPVRTLIAGVPPALLGFGVGYRVIAAVRSVFGW
ncbi:YIP1 family protein [Halorubrum sp. DTA98]|uniref:YIP1 family protein n=1 Tax=Halorubrum sp. DTA98 TaxID=3402163 RepID=UPI003AAE539D